ncbi:MAG: tetratricopeptide repeat protein [Bacteroidales bacterium]
MSKKNSTPSHDQFEAVESALSRTEQLIEDNSKTLTIVVVAIILVFGAVWGYRQYKKPIERDAQAQLFMAEQYFAKDSFNLALNGDGNNLGFLDIIEDYGITKAANLAEYYAGISYLHMENYQEAIAHLENFDSDDKMLHPIALGSMGDAHVELKELDKGLRFYEKAIDASDNEFTAPIYLMKSALVYEQQANYEKALELYEKIRDKYPESAEAEDIEKHIGRAQALQNN